jgi:hypothetical protein
LLLCFINNLLLPFLYQKSPRGRAVAVLLVTPRKSFSPSPAEPQKNPGANPTTAIYNASAVKIYNASAVKSCNATNSLVRFKTNASAVKIYHRQRCKKSTTPAL